MMKFLQVILLISCALGLTAQPVALHEDISIKELMLVGGGVTRIDVDPATNELYYAKTNGDIHKVDTETGTDVKIFSNSDHGLNEIYGFEIGASGNIYLVSMVSGADENIAYVKKYDGSTWTTMVTATYPRSSRDHRFNAVIETPDQQHILVNSGARTDHGELKSNDQRENAFTAKLLKFPVDTENLTLEDNDDFMNQYVFARGLRNTYDIEYNAEGLLFGLDQADQSDHQEEMNWIQEGKHYGFPWKIGVNEILMQYPDYDPLTDPLLTDVTRESTFHNDPNFPSKPGIFIEPIINHGPDQDLFRDTVDAKIKDASDIGRSLGTFTPHSSPVGLTFDVTNSLGGEFTGKAFSVSWSNTNDRKFVPFDQIGEDLLMIDLEKVGDNYEANIHRIAEGFNHPVDAAMIGNKLYILEYADDAFIYVVTFPEANAVVLNSGLNKEALNIFPNGFNNKVNIDVSLGISGKGSVSIFSLQGQKIITLWEGEYKNDLNFSWDGKSSSGTSINPGIYMVKVVVGDIQINGRLIKRE